MRKDAQANAAISILDNFLDGQNLNSTLFKWTKNNRYAGSSDRESIRNIVFDILRVKKTFTSVLEKEKQPINGRALVFLHSVFYAFNLNDIFTVPVNLAGLPGISIPAGHDAKGYPLGLQIIGKAFDEQNILNIAYAMEEKINFINKINDWWIK